MQKTVLDTVQTILTIAQYPQDRKKFAAEFEALNFMQAILRVYEDLPVESQEFIKNHPDDQEAIIEHIPEEAYREALFAIRIQALQDLIKVVSPTLTLRQKEEMNQLVVAL